MEIRSVRHKGLRRIIETGNASGLPAAFVDKIRNILSFLQDMGSVAELQAMPAWRAHLLTDDRRGTWSLTVSRNWRITFGVDQAGEAIIDLDYEDYH
jgi:proteic killer suppression protein